MIPIRLYLFIFTLCLAIPTAAQPTLQETGVSGIVVDGETGDPLPDVQIYFLKPQRNKGMVPSETGTTSAKDGLFSISNTEGYYLVQFQLLGYKTNMVTLRKNQFRTNIVVRMTPNIYGLQDVIVTPKHDKHKYRRRGNPAVELIKNVIARKDSFSVKTEDRYTVETYSRMSYALDNPKMRFDKGFWKNFPFVEKYIDSSGVHPNLAVSIREHMGVEYYQRAPHREKKILQKKRIHGVEEVLSSRSFKETTKAVFKDVDINDNSMNVLFNRFVSPLSSTLAVTFYQYYIIDTLLMEGYPCIDLAFAPVNSESYGFTGHLYIINDSTFRIKKYTINVPPEINLNFVNGYSIEHSYTQLDNGLWAPERTTTRTKFYVFNHKRGVLAQQTKLYSHWDFDSPIDKSTFSEMKHGEEIASVDSNAVWLPSAAWDTLRPEPLSAVERSVENMVDEFYGTPKYNSLAHFLNAISTGYVATTPAHLIRESKFDIGPVYNFVSWNKLEGVRFRFGGMTTGKLHPQIFARGYVAFGTTDLRPKYEATLTYTFDKHSVYAYDAIRHHLQWTAGYDVEVPGQATEVIRRDHILMSIPTNSPSVGYAQYVFHAKAEYMKEWPNKLSVRAAFDFTHNEAAGLLTYQRCDGTDIGSFRNYEGLVELQYQPGSRTFIDRSGQESIFAMEKDAPTLRLTHYVGYMDDRYRGGDGFVYNHTEFLFDKRFWFSAFGHLDMRLQAGIVWQKVPFPKLYTPATSTSIILSRRTFNLMQPMEFMMDKYVSLFATYYFKGWIINRIPGLNKLQLRGVVSVAAIYGGLSKRNNPSLADDKGLYVFPQECSPIGALPYIEMTAGFENIFKCIRIDYVRRLTYTEGTGVWGRNGIKVSLRLAL